MTKYIYVLLMVMVLVLPCGVVQAQQRTDTLSIRYRLDSIRIDMGFANNAEAWSTFERNFNEHYKDVSPNSLRLDIYSGASPEGTGAHNRWLGENRGQAIRRLVRQKLPGRVGSIIVHNEAARWDAFYESIAASDEPWRDEVLRILDMPASADENRWDHREYKLRALRGGSIWPILLDKYLSPLRSGATAILSWAPPARDTLYIAPDGPAAPNPPYPPYPPYPPTYPNCPYPCPKEPVDSPVLVKRQPVERYPVWILRSNLPLLATGTPNLQAEFPIGHKDRWSVNIEGVWSWWTFAFNDFANEIIYGSLELRYWLGQRWKHHSLDGWHLGLAIGGGYGDLEWKSRGFQGEVYSAFVNIGWQRRFGRRKQWAFDAGIGLGFAHVPWRRYTGSRLFPIGREEEHSDHLMWRETGLNNWIGTPHLNISLGYVFPFRDARWRRMKALERDAERNAYLHFRDSVKARERYERDSIKTSDKLRLREIELLPRAERKEAMNQFESELKLRQDNERTARALAKTEAKQRKQREHEERIQHRQLEAADKAKRKEELRLEREYAKTPEGKAALEEKRAEQKAQRQAEKVAKKQASEAQRAAKKQAKKDAKLERVRMRIELEHQRNLEELQRKMEKADGKYKRVDGVEWKVKSEK